MRKASDLLQEAAQRPVSSDPNYTITQEKGKFVLRWKDEIIGTFSGYSAAAVRAVGHKSMKDGNLVIAEVPVKEARTYSEVLERHGVSSIVELDAERLDSFIADVRRLSEGKDISDEKSFREYAKKVLRKAHKDDYDEEKAKETIDGILKKADGDMDKAVGMLSGGVSESVEDYPRKSVHIDDIKPGDVVFHDGKIMTVNDKDLKKGGFMGTTLFGDSYRSGSKKVELVVIPNHRRSAAVKEGKEITDEKSFREYAETVLKKAHKDDYDEAKAKETIDGILKKADGDMEKAVGMLSGSVSESAVLEGKSDPGKVVMSVMGHDVVFLTTVYASQGKVLVRLIPRTAADLDFIGDHDDMVDNFVQSTLYKAVRHKSPAAGYTYEVPLEIIQEMVVTALNG